jgi:hypothetical protein
MNIWAKSVIAAAISGAAAALGSAVLDPTHLGDWPHLRAIAVGGALIGVIGYLKKSPVWD